jgi:hypothetical protein
LYDLHIYYSTCIHPFASLEIHVYVEDSVRQANTYPHNAINQYRFLGVELAHENITETRIPTGDMNAARRADR